MERRSKLGTSHLTLVFLFATVAIGGFFVSLLFGVTGCTQAQTQQLSSATVYKRDMLVTVNGVTTEGINVQRMNATNVVHVVAAGDLDLFTMANCDSEKVKPQAWNQTTTIKSGLFGWSSKTIPLKREVEFTYVPQGMESLGACPLQLYGFAKDGQHSWGFIDFKTDTFKLRGKILCNGESKIFDGVDACQSRAGLFQQLSFGENVFMSPDPGCELDRASGKDFNFPIPSGTCVYRIKGVDTGLLGKLTLIGYTSILVRGQ